MVIIFSPSTSGVPGVLRQLVSYELIKKYACYSGFLLRGSSPDSPKPRGDLRNPEGMAGPRAVGPRARHTRGVFQIPDRAEGDLAKIPEEENPNNMHIFFVLFAKLESTATTANNYHHALLTTF